MVRTWLAIAKAEFQVLSSSMRRNRKLYVGILYALALVWAVVLTPMTVSYTHLTLPTSDLV